jgi:hypothetical protein
MAPETKPMAPSRGLQIPGVSDRLIDGGLLPTAPRPLAMRQRGLLAAIPQPVPESLRREHHIQERYPDQLAVRIDCCGRWQYGMHRCAPRRLTPAVQAIHAGDRVAAGLLVTGAIAILNRPLCLMATGRPPGLPFITTRPCRRRLSARSPRTESKRTGIVDSRPQASDLPPLVCIKAAAGAARASSTGAVRSGRREVMAVGQP